MKIEIMDTTLRDGEQTSGISFTDVEKLNIAKLLLNDLKIDRIEVASARVSEGEFKAVKAIVDWAKKKKYLNKIEVLGFVDDGVSLDWINKAGAKVLNLLTKGSLKHVTGQLRKSPEQHSEDIKKNILLAQKMGFKVNVYLEDWSNGMRNSPDYVYFMIDAMKKLPIERIMLPDTLGILNPDETYKFCKAVIDKYPSMHFDFHAHNDYDLAVANVYSAIKAGAKGIHTTVNGLGERAGNAPLSSVIALLKDHCKVNTSVTEKKINLVSRMVETFSGIRIPANKPIIGDNVFTQTSGVHADGDNKNNLYYNDLLPERFGRERQYALGKTAGKSNILKNLQQLGIELDAESMKKVTKRVIELGDMKEHVTTEDLPYIISDVLNSEVINSKIKIKNFALSSVNGLKPVAVLSIEINKKVYEETASGDGQYDAFMKALKKIYSKLHKKIPKLIDYIVTIPPGGKTDALVETIITWKNAKEFRTRGLDSDQTVAAIKATLKMLNIIEKE
jgi:(R)-citramalate synthase